MWSFYVVVQTCVTLLTALLYVCPLSIYPPAQPCICMFLLYSLIAVVCEHITFITTRPNCCAMCRLRYYASPNTPLAVYCSTGLAWLTSFSIIALVPIDVWATMSEQDNEIIGVLWDISYWYVWHPAAYMTHKCLHRTVPGMRQTLLNAALTLICCDCRITFLLTWLFIPIHQGYVDAGDFSVSGRYWYHLLLFTVRTQELPASLTWRFVG